MTGPTIVSDGLVLKHNYDAGAVVPVSDGAVYFDGTDDEIDCGASTNFITGNNVTMACWFRVLDGDDTTLMHNQRGDGSSNLNLSVNYKASGSADGYLTGIVWGGSAHTYLEYDGSVDTSNRWHHAAITTTASEQKLYLDGVLVDTNSETFSNSASSDEMYLGAFNGGTNFLKGYMCNAAVWSATLTQAQIKSIMWKNYAGLTDSEKTNLVSWWNLDSIATGSDGSYVRDYHYGGNSSELGSEIYTTNNALSSQPYEADDESTNITLNSALAKTVFTPTANIGEFSLKLSLINATNDRMSTSFSTTSGKLYEISFYMKFSQGVYNTAEHGAQETYSFKVGTSDNDATNASIALLDIFTLSYGSFTSSTTDWYNYKIRFKASASTSHFTFIKTDALGGSLSTFIYFDDFSVKEVIGNPGDLQ